MSRNNFEEVILACAALASLTASFGSYAQGQSWTADVFYENDTHYRGADYSGDTVGLSKFRNTIQADIKGGLGDGWALRTILRGSYDGVYALNDNEYGKKAGGAITLDSIGGPPPLPFGGGVVNHVVVANAFGLTNNTFGFNSTNPNAPNYNPNQGLQLLGQRWHGTNGGGAEFGVPVRPCNVDHRGCVDFGGYGDLTENKLAFSEFDKRLDFIRELYVTKDLDLGGTDHLFLKIGKQQVIWGRTDLFRVLDVINPVDFSRNNIYDELQDIRIPMWITTAEWRMGATSHLQDSNLQLVWNFDKFRPDDLGQCGTPNVILDAGCFFRAIKNLWDNGGTVSNFANVAPGTFLSTDFGPGQIGLRNVDLPGWSLRNSQIGLKYEGVTPGGFSFSLNALSYRSQLPSLHGAKGAQNPFTGVTRTDAQGGNPYLIAFDMVYPRVQLIGGSADFELKALKAAVRLEGAVTHGEEFPNTLRPELFSENKVLRSVIGIDRPTFIPFISSTRTTLISGQLFFQHIFNYQMQQGPLGQVGMPDWENNAIGTLLIKAFLVNDRVSPQIITAYDFRAHAVVVAPSLEWIFNNHLKLTIGANLKTADKIQNWKFDDCRSCNPFPPFTAGPDYPGNPLDAFSRGLGGLEPLGRFRAGPIGAAWKENEAIATVRYAF